MSQPNLQSEPVRQLLQVFLEQVLGGAVAPSAVAQQQQLLRTRITLATVLLPPGRNTVARQLTGVVARVQMHESLVATGIVQTVRIQLPQPVTPEIVVVGRDRILPVDHAVPMEVPPAITSSSCRY